MLQGRSRVGIFLMELGSSWYSVGAELDHHKQGLGWYYGRLRVLTFLVFGKASAYIF